MTGGSRAESRLPPDSVGNQGFEGSSPGPEDLDTFQVMNGVKAIFGRAAWAAGSGIQYLRPDQQGPNGSNARNQQGKDALERQMFAQQMAHLAVWNAQMTTVGGVHMTNGEAQRIRQHMIDNEDQYAERAVQEGRISADETGEFKSTLRRMHDLEDRKGRGVATDAEQRESVELRESRMGRIVDQDVGQTHLDQKVELGRNQEAARSSDALPSRASAAATYDPLFQDTPRLTGRFEQAAQPIDPIEHTRTPSLPVEVSPKVAVMGLGI